MAVAETDGAPIENLSGEIALQTAQANGRASVWDHQGSDGLSEISIEGPGQSEFGMDVGVCQLQPQAAFRAQNPRGNGIRMMQRG